MPEPVLLPGDPVAAGGSDLLGPTSRLLEGLGFRPSENPSGKDSQTPDSIQVIQAGSLAFSRFWTKTIAGASGTVTIGSVVPALLAEDSGVRVTLIAGAAVILAAAAIAIAVVISSDVRGRAAASVARTNSAAALASQFIESAAALQQPAPDGTNASVVSLIDQLLAALTAFKSRLESTLG